MNRNAQRAVQQAQQQMQRNVQAYQLQKKLSKEKAVREAVYRINVLNGICLDCSGDGKKWLFFDCGKCGGSGRVGFCQACGGKGKGWFFRCKYCNGSGRVANTLVTEDIDSPSETDISETWNVPEPAQQLERPLATKKRRRKPFFAGLMIVSGVVTIFLAVAGQVSVRSDDFMRLIVMVFYGAPVGGIFGRLSGGGIRSFLLGAFAWLIGGLTACLGILLSMP